MGERWLMQGMIFLQAQTQSFIFFFFFNTQKYGHLRELNSNARYLVHSKQDRERCLEWEHLVPSVVTRDLWLHLYLNRKCKESKEYNAESTAKPVSLTTNWTQMAIDKMVNLLIIMIKIIIIMIILTQHLSTRAWWKLLSIPTLQYPSNREILKTKRHNLNNRRLSCWILSC